MFSLSRHTKKKKKRQIEKIVLLPGATECTGPQRFGTTASTATIPGLFFTKMLFFGAPAGSWEFEEQGQVVIGVERKEDELATLYDILFDEEILWGMRMFTETRRCYRLTKQAFINVSYGKTLQSGLTSQGSAPPIYKWKKNDTFANNHDWRNAKVDNYNSQKGFHQNHQQSQFNKSASQNTVTQFFSAYRQPNAMNISKISQIAKQDLEMAKSTTQTPTTSGQPAKALNDEFQAVWTQLQQKLPASPPAQFNPSPPSSGMSPLAVSEQTNALKKILRIDGGESVNDFSSTNSPVVHPVEECWHNGQCGAELSSICSRLGLSFLIAQRVDQKSGEVHGIVTFQDGSQFVGPGFKSPQQAVNAVACMTLREHPVIRAKRTSSNKMGMKGGPPGMPIPAARGLPYPFGNRARSAQGVGMPGTHLVQNFQPQALHRIPGPPPMIPAQTLLPNPPQQWCQQPSSTASTTKSTVNPFVPLQAQAAAIVRNAPDGRTKPHEQQQEQQELQQQPQRQPPPPTSLTDHRLNNNVVRPIPQSPKKKTPEQPTSSTQQQQPQSRKNRRPRIAAKFSTPLDK